MDVGQTRALTANVLPSNAANKAVTWSSSNASIITVSCSGTVTARTEGFATITAKTVDGGYASSMNIKVEALITDVEIIITEEE